MTKTFKLTPNLIQKMYAYGLTVSSIRKILNLTEDEFDNLMLDDRYCRASVKGKEIADFQVRESLHKNAVGYKEEDVHFYSYQGELHKEKFRKYYPPNMTAIIFWLKNRYPNEWKEKVESGGTLDEETLTRLREIAVKEIDEHLL